MFCGFLHTTVLLKLYFYNYFLLLLSLLSDTIALLLLFFLSLLIFLQLEFDTSSLPTAFEILGQFQSQNLC